MVLCEYPSQALEGHHVRIEVGAHGFTCVYRRGAEILEDMRVEIPPKRAIAHLLLAMRIARARSAA